MNIHQRQAALSLRLARRLEHIGQSDEDHLSVMEALDIMETTKGVLSLEERLIELLLRTLDVVAGLELTIFPPGDRSIAIEISRDAKTLLAEAKREAEGASR